MDNNDQKNNKTFYQDNRRIIKSFVFTLTILGAIAWANLGLNVFTSGTSISSTDVNANFATLESAILNHKSDYVLSNSTNLTMNGSCYGNFYGDMILDSSTGYNTTDYDTGTGLLTPSVSGAYRIVVMARHASPTVDFSMKLCHDERHSPDNCATATKLNFDINIWAKTNELPYVIDYVRSLESGNTYRVMHSYCKSSSDTFAAGDIKVYINLVR